MRSRFADKFNHDAEAGCYDRDVLDESNPLRAGYSGVLDWVASEAGPGRAIVELGSGTGNLALRLPGFRRLVCVDVSREMLRIARRKLADLRNVDYVESDILEYFERSRGVCDAVVSTYAVHHLTAPEKTQLFRAVDSVLENGGVAVFGDLMFEDGRHRQDYLDRLRRTGRTELADEIEDEFFWDAGPAAAELEALGFRVTVKRFSELSWGMSARRAGP